MNKLELSAIAKEITLINSAINYRGICQIEQSNI